MQKSARILGQEYGLTAEEMNRVLVKHGFLEGEPGDYSLTEKALEYAKEQYNHRGCGGYACYNRYWPTRTFDDSIKERLEVTNELKAEVRAELAAVRAARKAERIAAKAEAEAANLAKRAAEEAAKKASEEAAARTLERNETLKKTGLVGVVIVSAAGAGYGIYKLVPRVKRWWNNRKRSEQDKLEEMKE